MSGGELWREVLIFGVFGCSADEACYYAIEQSVLLKGSYAF